MRVASLLALSLWLCAPQLLAETPKGAVTGQVPSVPKLLIIDTLSGDAKTSQLEGKAAFERGDWVTAGAQFERAYAASRDPRMLWNRALAEKGQKHPARAAALVQRFVKERGKSLTPQERRDADELRKALESAASKLKLSVSEPDAQAFIDEELVGSTPITAPILVDPGTKKIRVSKSGFKDASETETFSTGSTVQLEIVLQPDLHEGRLHVKAGPGDTIWLDGRVVGQGEWEAPVASGHHYVSVTAPGKRSYENETSVRDAEMRELRISLAEDDSQHSAATALWIAGGAALVAGAAVGGYFLFRSTPTEGPAPVPATFGAIRLP